jgi:uncharacterized protein YndB with AHSA1/START domain
MEIIEGSIVIKRPVDKVFAYATDFKHMPEWQSTMSNIEQTSPGPMGVGATFRWVSHTMGLRMRTNAEIVEYEPNKIISFDMKWGSMTGKTYFLFESVEGGTKFTERNDLNFSGFYKLFSPLSVNSLRKVTKVIVNNLKNICESQT